MITIMNSGIKRNGAVTVSTGTASPVRRMLRRGGLMLATLAAFAVVAPAQAQFSPSYKFLDAVKKKDGDAVNDALSNPASQIVNTRDLTTGESALHIVTARRDLTWMQFLVSKGANVNVADNKGTTPLEVAAELGFVEGVQYLISAGARVDESNNTGSTPLIEAVSRRDLALVRVLLKAGANPDRPDNSGRSARDYAQLEGKNSNVLAEIENSTKEKAAAGATRKTYGPTF
ncbi:ankyrin [Novosphingobium nitrogenifigens DSM 19370]|uniref:Ankyrin n=1 Tax=Novosphingobium nitrogenifigens DSM 19370 TaxID=983920 RepID=F1ZBN6_9SPHN|nr:ankyrin repeat domain-containing protein [Novosphingobium nitrogenifigens]EGD57878.1 ankyrin [Novosphingobium nitrogenifigens DSM 19370]